MTDSTMQHKTEVKITFERGNWHDPASMVAHFGAGQVADFTGPLTRELPGLTTIRIDPRTRTIAVDGISGDACRAEPLAPEWLIHDLRGGRYGDFHQLRLPEDCSDRECVGSGAPDPVYRRILASDDARRTA